MSVRRDAMLPLPSDVQHAIDKLRSLREGDLGVVEFTACGTRVIPALRALLFARERSGLYHARRRAVAALAALGAYDVLMDFLTAYREAGDAVERLGDEAVINAAALALANLREERVFRLLLALVARRLLPGVIGALGTFRRPETIPHLIDALAEDDCRVTAEAAIRKFGRAAQPGLLRAAERCRPPSDRESVSSRRRRRSALGLLAELGISRKAWRKLRHLMRDEDAHVAVLACSICLEINSIADMDDAVRRLIELLHDADWMLAEEIANCLTLHFDKAKQIIAMAARASEPGDKPADPRAVDVLRGIMSHAAADAAPEMQ
jgi:HEAT repeat protein